MVVTTPAGQLHELGALVVAAAAASEGWRATYLGPNLPAEEIAGAAEQNEAKAVALSIIYPADDPRQGYELEKLRRYLRDGVVLFVGGRATESYRKTLDAIGAVRSANIPNFRAALKTLRYQESSP
jgi:methanogenic corrinoid protein MtbC1